jgi:hypothetical protein
MAILNDANYLKNQSAIASAIASKKAKATVHVTQNINIKLL